MCVYFNTHNLELSHKNDQLPLQLPYKEQETIVCIQKNKTHIYKSLYLKLITCSFSVMDGKFPSTEYETPKARPQGEKVTPKQVMTKLMSNIIMHQSLDVVKQKMDLKEEELKRKNKKLVDRIKD